MSKSQALRELIKTILVRIGRIKLGMGKNDSNNHIIPQSNSQENIVVNNTDTPTKPESNKESISTTQNTLEFSEPSTPIINETPKIDNIKTPPKVPKLVFNGYVDTDEDLVNSKIESHPKVPTTDYKELETKSESNNESVLTLIVPNTNENVPPNPVLNEPNLENNPNIGVQKFIISIESNTESDFVKSDNESFSGPNTETDFLKSDSFVNSETNTESPPKEDTEKIINESSPSNEQNLETTENNENGYNTESDFKSETNIEPKDENLEIEPTITVVEPTITVVEPTITVVEVIQS